MKGCRPYTEAEVSVILESFDGQYAKRDRALFLVGIKTGFRISELLSLRIGDVIQGGKVVEKVTVQRRNMKKRIQGRTILLHPEARSALVDWIEELRTSGYMAASDYVFQSRKGGNQPISRVQAWRILNDAGKEAGLAGRVGTHSMRKTYADRMYDRLGHDLVKLQKALGHVNINSTGQYLSFREEEIDEAILAI